MTSSVSPLPVSTVLLTKNSMRSLPQYFDSMRIVDDIIVLDGGSTDGTREFVQAQPNARLFDQDPHFLDAAGYIQDFSALRNAGYVLARHPWILCVDADEEAGAELLTEVRRVVERDIPGVYFVQRTFTLDGRPVVMFPGSGFDQIRLFHLSCVRGCVKPVHERLDIIPGSPKKILPVPVFVPLAPASAVRPKFDRYLKIEIAYGRNMPWGRWLRWRLLRNMISIPRMFAANLATYVIPKRGPRYPFPLVWEQARYSWLLLWRTAPWRTSS
ncbi:MAG TPA: glycosyltransferase [Candidatus Peribacteraceae bacterium]|nr:glycosyltransferase [Candidatus Peribacteraceae bacterium]